MERTVAALRRAVRAGRPSGGLTLALENHADLELAEIEAVLEALDAPHLGVCFDTSNWVRVGDDPVEAARRLQGRVRLVHLKDHVVRPDDGITGPSSVELGTGEVDVRGVLDVLLAAEPDVAGVRRAGPSRLRRRRGGNGGARRLVAARGGDAA